MVALRNYFCIGRYFIERGLDINHTDDNGNSALNISIMQRNPDFITLLIHRGIDHTKVNRQGQSILHLAAYYGNVETTKVLANEDLRGIDPEMTDENGMTAMQVLGRRPAVSEGFEIAFELLVSHLRHVWSGEFFVDAREN